MVGMARCAVPARVVAGATNIRATLAFGEVAPLHAARTSQRDVPTTLNTYPPAPSGEGELERASLGFLFGDPASVPPKVPLSLRKRERVRVRVRLDCMDAA